jgi:hypothetical protein
MPNWCNNTVEIYHDDPVMIERARKAFNDAKFLNEFVPIPESLQIVSGRCGADDNPEQIALEAAQKSNIEQHGYKDWYDFCVNEWGTKWDVGGDGYEAQDIPGGLMLTFESAWAPPLNAYEKMLALGFKIHATYFEGGMMFAGDWDNGIDDYYELGDMSSEEIQEELPEHLDEAYGISEMKAEWEDEEAADQED